MGLGLEVYAVLFPESSHYIDHFRGIAVCNCRASIWCCGLRNDGERLLAHDKCIHAPQNFQLTGLQPAPSSVDQSHRWGGPFRHQRIGYSHRAIHTLSSPCPLVLLLIISNFYLWKVSFDIQVQQRNDTGYGELAILRRPTLEEALEVSDAFSVHSLAFALFHFCFCSLSLLWNRMVQWRFLIHNLNW